MAKAAEYLRRVRPNSYTYIDKIINAEADGSVNRAAVISQVKQQDEDWGVIVSS